MLGVDLESILELLHRFVVHRQPPPYASPRRTLSAASFGDSTHLRLQSLDTAEVQASSDSAPDALPDRVPKEAAHRRESRPPERPPRCSECCRDGQAECAGRPGSVRRASLIRKRFPYRCTAHRGLPEPGARRASLTLHDTATLVSMFRRQLMTCRANLRYFVTETHPVHHAIRCSHLCDT